MRFRSHVNRGFDFTTWPNVAFGVLVASNGATATILWLENNDGGVFFAPVYTGLIWALIREIDPDHHSTALTGGAFAGAWLLAGGDVMPALGVASLMIAARLLTNTTGSRPLVTDYLVVGLLATVAGLTAPGWVAGFCIAIAMYIDHRVAGDPSRAGLIAAVTTALAVTLTASFSGALVDLEPLLRSSVVTASGLIAIAIIAREPATPTTRVDSRRVGTTIDGVRLHGSRSMLAVATFLMAVLLGTDAISLAPLLVALGLVIVSNEIALVTRR